MQVSTRRCWWCDGLRTTVEAAVVVVVVMVSAEVLGFSARRCLYSKYDAELQREHVP